MRGVRKDPSVQSEQLELGTDLGGPGKAQMAAGVAAGTESFLEPREGFVPLQWRISALMLGVWIMKQVGWALRPSVT